MINETRKILNKPYLPITATTVRVPVKNCHSESINIELERDFDIFDIKQLLQNSPGILVIDEPSKNYYPIASKADGTDDVLVGRIRRDFSVRSGLNIWVVADNLRKGAASNAIQILEVLFGDRAKTPSNVFGGRTQKTSTFYNFLQNKMLYFILYFSNRGVFWDGLKKHLLFTTSCKIKCYILFCILVIEVFFESVPKNIFKFLYHFFKFVL